MIATSQTIQEAAQTLPDQPPSERDLQIFAAVKVESRRQVEVAAEHGISQSRVSQIVRQVVQWRTAVGVNADLETRDRKVVEAWIDTQRLESLYEHTLELFRRSCQPRRSERRGTNQHGEWQAEAIDHPPGNLQCLRLAARLLELRWQMEAKFPQPSPHALAHADESIFINRLISMRHWAEVRGEVPRGEPAGDLVERLLDELLGKRSPETGLRGQASGDRQETGDRGQEMAHTAHIMSAAELPSEPEDQAESIAPSTYATATCGDAADDAELPGELREGEEKLPADMSRQGTSGQDSRGTQDRGQAGSDFHEVESGADEEQLALAELRRAFEEEISPPLADHIVPNLLAWGQANLLLQGYTRQQRTALVGWQRVMERRKRESGVGGQQLSTPSNRHGSE